MTEAVETAHAIRSLPLDDAHRRLGAVMIERDGWLVPAYYGDAKAEYEIVRAGGAGLIDLSARGRLEVGGAEAVQFLNGLITNDVKTLAPRAWMLAAFPNVQGRLLAFARVLRRDDEQKFLFDTEASTHERVWQTLMRFTLAGDFRVTDVTTETAHFSLQGAQSAAIVKMLFGDVAAPLERGRVLIAKMTGAQSSVTLMRATHTSEDGFDLIVDAKDAAMLWQELIDVGARPIGAEAWEVLRIEAGVLRYGIDMTDANVVLETGLDEAISYTKGCYVGQEIIARIHWRGHVAKKLTGLNLDGDEKIERAAKIKTPDGKEIGRVTSRAFSPQLKRTIALGYVKYDYLKEGTEVIIASEAGERAARVVELPFVRGSWHDDGDAPPSAEQDA